MASILQRFRNRTVHSGGRRPVRPATPAWREAPALRTVAALAASTDVAGFAHAISRRRDWTVLRATRPSSARLRSAAAAPIGGPHPTVSRAARTGVGRPPRAPARASYADPDLPDVAAIEATDPGVGRAEPHIAPSPPVLAPRPGVRLGPGSASAANLLTPVATHGAGEPAHVAERPRPADARRTGVRTEPAPYRPLSPAVAPAAPAPARSSSVPPVRTQTPAAVNRRAAPEAVGDEPAAPVPATPDAEVTQEAPRPAVHDAKVPGKPAPAVPARPATATGQQPPRTETATAVYRSAAIEPPPEALSPERLTQKTPTLETQTLETHTPETPMQEPSTEEASSPATAARLSVASGGPGEAEPRPTEEPVHITSVKAPARAEVSAALRRAGRPTSVQRAAPRLGRAIRSAPLPAGEPSPPAAPRLPRPGLVSNPPPALAVSRAAPDAPAIDPSTEPPATSWTGSPAQPAAAPATSAGMPPVPELADLIYTRIERRLRMELLLERERKGSLSDVRWSVEGR